jgi:TPR repeat protein
VRLALVETRRALQNETAPLGVALTAPLAQGAVVLRNVTPGARVAMGTALGGGAWRIALGDLPQAALGPPADFVGAMDVAVELLLADETVADRSMMRIEWAPAAGSSPPPAQSQAQPQSQALAAPEPDLRSAVPPPAGGPTLDRDELATLLKRGQDFLANGDLASARLVLRRAADGGDAQAALLLGSTFDPAMFKQLKVIGAAPDPAQARMWYQRAVELGSTEAVRRLEPLARGAR